MAQRGEPVGIRIGHRLDLDVQRDLETQRDLEPKMI